MIRLKITNLLVFALLIFGIAFSSHAKSDWQWPIAKPESVGLDSKVLKKAHRMIKSNKYDYMDSLLVIKDGKLVFEKYYNKGSKKKPHQLESAGKSLLSAVFGVLWDQKKIKSLETRVFDYFRQFFDDIKNWDERKEKMTLHNLLTMRAGWDCDINFAKYRCSKMMGTGRDNIEALKWVLDRPMTFEPGSKMQYTDVNPIVIDTLVFLISGKTTAQIAEEFLFKPMGVELSDFSALTSRHMAMFGQLFLKKGNWHGTQVLSEEWIEKSTANIYPFNRKKPGIVQGYGYYWWVGNYKSQTNDLVVEGFMAAGNGGQYVVILPELEIVVVMTGHDYNQPGMTRSLNIVQEFVLPSVLER